MQFGMHSSNPPTTGTTAPLFSRSQSVPTTSLKSGSNDINSAHMHNKWHGNQQQLPQQSQTQQQQQQSFPILTPTVHSVPTNIGRNINTNTNTTHNSYMHGNYNVSMPTSAIDRASLTGLATVPAGHVASINGIQSSQIMPRPQLQQSQSHSTFHYHQYGQPHAQTLQLQSQSQRPSHLNLQSSQSDPSGLTNKTRYGANGNRMYGMNGMNGTPTPTGISGVTRYGYEHGSLKIRKCEMYLSQLNFNNMPFISGFDIELELLSQNELKEFQNKLLNCQEQLKNNYKEYKSDLYDILHFLKNISSKPSTNNSTTTTTTTTTNRLSVPPSNCGGKHKRNKSHKKHHHHHHQNHHHHHHNHDPLSYLEESSLNQAKRKAMALEKDLYAKLETKKCALENEYYQFVSRQFEILKLKRKAMCLQAINNYSNNTNINNYTHMTAHSVDECRLNALSNSMYGGDKYNKHNNSNNSNKDTNNNLNGNTSNNNNNGLRQSTMPLLNTRTMTAYTTSHG